MALFANRKDAGKKLSQKLSDYKEQENVIVLALPRGGVPIGYEIAKAINTRLDVFLVRKLGVPQHPELAMGAISSGGVTALNDNVVNALGISENTIYEVIENEKQELERREQVYRGDRPFPDLTGTVVILTDDGIATGATMKAAVKAVQTKNPKKLIVAVPTGAKSACDSLEDLTDKTVCLSTPEPFQAIGQWYMDFPQLEDQAVRDYLEAAPK